MLGAGFKLLAYFLSLSLYANHALARASNVTFSDAPTTCSPVTISWQGGTAPFTLIVMQVDTLTQPGLDGTVPGVPVQVAAAGSARRVVWTADVEPGQTLIAVVRDGGEQNASSDKRVVQPSSDVACLAVAAVTQTHTSASASALPSLTTSSNGTLANPSETPPVTNYIALPVLLTIFTIGIIVSFSVYGFYIYRSGAPKRSGNGLYDDIERGRYEGKASLRSWGTYSKQLSRGISRKISALGSQISRRPAAVVETEKLESFTILPEDPLPPVPQDVLQPSPESRADVVDPRSIVGAPIMPVRAIPVSPPTSGITVTTARGTMETRTGLSTIPPSNDKGLRPAPSKPNILGQGKPLPTPPPLHLGRQGTQRQYGLPTAGNRQEAMRPTNRSKSTNTVEPNYTRAPSLRRSVSAGAVARVEPASSEGAVALDSPPAHLAHVPMSALPPATPVASNIHFYSRVSVHPSPGPGATIQGASSRTRSNSIGPVVGAQEVPFVIAPLVIPPHFNQSKSTDTSGTESYTDLPTTRVPKPLNIPSTPSRSDEDGHADPFYDSPHTTMTARSRYSMALPDSASLLPTYFGAAQGEVAPPLPDTPIPLPMAAGMPSTPTSPTPGMVPP